MIRNFLIIAIRNFFRNKIFSIVNLSGLALGFAVSIFIVLFVTDELSYDRFHSNVNRIYRINAKGIFGNTKINQTYTCAPLPGVLVNDYPEVKKAVRIQAVNNVEVRYEEAVYNEDKLLAADSNFFEIFSFPILSGDPRTALCGNNKILLSESTARKYFGTLDPMGKVIRLDNEIDFEVTGIFKDIPPQSHIHFNFIGSLSTFNPDQNQNWMSNNYITYLLLREDADPAALESKFPELIHLHIWPEEGVWEKMKEAGNNWEYFLQPLTEIHLTSDLNGEFEPNGRKEYIYIFLFSAIFILVIAAINFTNLTTAKSEKRAREVGVRKVLGSNRRTLILQFLWESILTSVISMAMAYVIVILLLQSFNELSGKAFLLSDLTAPQFLIGCSVIAIMVGIMAGLYPSFYLSSFRPALVMKTGRGSARGNHRFRGILVIFQFFISITLIIGTLVIYSQLKFFQHSNLGFEKEKVLVIHGTDKLEGQFNVLRDNLLEYNQISHVCGTGWIPGGTFYNWGVSPEGWEENSFTTLNMIMCDTAFLNTMEMNMDQGRFFSSDFLSDSTAIIINEEAAKILGWNNPMGRKIKIWGQYDFEVIGVIKDFHYESMHQAVRPMGMITFSFSRFGNNYPRMAAVKIGGANPQETIRYIEEQWNSLAHGIPFRFSFMESDYQALYDNETKTGNVFLLYSILSILIASMGLFALSSYIIEQRTKEIGIRKVNGASAGNIVVLLTGEFTRWVFIAIAFAIPAGFWLMTKWLENFAYRTDLNIWIFAGAAFIGLMIAGLTISLQTIRASRQNPATSLRYE
jgi:putative ABC transport system permease protein